MKTEENIVIESIEEKEYKPQKSLIERMEDYEHEIESLKAENKRLQEEVSELQAKTCVDKHGYTAGEREKQVQELIQTLREKDNEILILQLQMDELSKEKEELSEGNSWLKQRVKELISEFQKTKLAKEQISNSEAAFEQVNKELARENEELKLTVRELKKTSSVIKVDTNEELSRQNIELHLKNTEMKRQVRDSDWTLSMINHHIQMISFLTNHFKEEVFL